jgi:glycosyltransferase involved in cell wall biosynthesis
MSLPELQSTIHAPASQISLPVSVVILTCNEAGNIADCIASCRWCDDLHVLDSGSTDATRDIAAQMGAQVHIHPFESFGQQRNWAIDHIPARHPWIFHLDADERFTDELLREIADELGPDGNRSDVGAYLVPNKMMFAGKWLRFSGGYPAYQVRLFRIGKCRFIDFGHGQRELTSEPVRKLRSPYLHYNFSHGVAGWLLKHNRYSDRESIEAEEVLASAVWPWGVVTRDGTQRRRALKNLSFRLRGRAVWRFLYMFVLRLGFLDGPAGFHYCAMTSMYEYWTELKLIERKSDWSRDNIAVAERLLRE